MTAIEKKLVFAPNGAIAEAIQKGTSEIETKELITLYGHDAGEFVESEVNEEKIKEDHS